MWIGTSRVVMAPNSLHLSVLRQWSGLCGCQDPAGPAVTLGIAMYFMVLKYLVLFRHRFDYIKQLNQQEDDQRSWIILRSHCHIFIDIFRPVFSSLILILHGPLASLYLLRQLELLFIFSQLNVQSLWWDFYSKWRRITVCSLPHTIHRLFIY